MALTVFIEGRKTVTESNRIITGFNRAPGKPALFILMVVKGLVNDCISDCNITDNLHSLPFF